MNLKASQSKITVQFSVIVLYISRAVTLFFYCVIEVLVWLNVYDLTGNFEFNIANFPWLDIDVPIPLSFGFNKYQLIRNTVSCACTNILDFHSKK